MRQLFEELVAELRRKNPAAIARLRPGLPAEVVREKMANLPYRISGDAVELYTWADGANGRFELLPGTYFIPLEDALAEFDMTHEMHDELQEIFFQPYRHSFRFLSDWSDGGYSFGRVDSPSEGRIVHLSIHDSWKLAYQDLAGLLKTSIECVRQGVLSPDRDIADFEAYYKLAAKLNPGMENWH